jgi:acyl transferase domain-containing protein
MLAYDGKCKTFDMYADGYVRGEGVGCIVLTRLGDNAYTSGVGGRTHGLPSYRELYGFIKGSCVNQDGRSASFTAPNAVAQTNLLAGALRRARVHPHQVVYLEAHGTGTSIGDPIECEGIRGAYHHQCGSCVLESNNTKDNSSCSSSSCVTVSRHPGRRVLPLYVGAVKTNIGHLGKHCIAA